ncbi:MAG TPA: hypothetical protein DHV08_08900, partial [Rhodocyclaceae bacterium]|nr:hypothetical protein [Rhodocyclaceae bacterium]
MESNMSEKDKSSAFGVFAKDYVPLPPKDADVFTTACDYCTIACGYKVYRWPVGREGGSGKAQNAIGADFPHQLVNTGAWVSPSQHNIVR